MLLVVVLLAVFAGRLFDLQVVRADELNAEAATRRSIEVTLHGQRVDIVDSNGVVLAGSVERFNITASPRFVAPFERTVDGVTTTVSVEEAVAELAEATGGDAAGILESITDDPESDFAYVIRRVDYDVRTAVRALEIPWVYSETESIRIYPNGAVGGNLVGFRNDGPGAGIEMYMDDCLAATDGTETYDRGADGVRIPGSTITTQPEVDGDDVVLTIDSDLQWYAQQIIGQETRALDAEWGLAVVIEVETGKLRAVAEYPSVDPNNPGGTDPSTWASRSFSSPYEPGSIMKPFTMAALLEEGEITPLTEVTAESYWSPENDVELNDAFAHETWHLTATGVLVNSSNVGTAKLSQRLTAAQIDEYFRAFGFGSRSDVLFGGTGGDSAGIFRAYREWDRQTRYNVTIGQGISVTGVQMASGFQAIGNDGVRLPVSLVEGCRAEDGTMTDTPSTEGTRVISAETSREVLSMMENMLTKGSIKDTASISGYRIATKTGTAEVAIGGVYTDERNISVVGLAPAEDPKYVVLVTYGLPQNSRVSTAAAPAFRKIMAQVLKTYRVEPSTTKAEDLPVYTE